MNPFAARCRFLLAGVATAATLAVPASASAAPAPAAAASGCPDVPVSQPFARWSDTADYFLAPGGGFERGAAGWTLRGGARVVTGNAPFKVVAPTDARSLSLPAGSSATTPRFCIGVEHRTMRFFARAAARRSLNVEVLYTDCAGSQRTLSLGDVTGAGRWAPTDVVPMIVNRLAAAHDNAMTVRLRFTPRRSKWTIDDVHIDPYRGR